MHAIHPMHHAYLPQGNQSVYVGMVQEEDGIKAGSLQAE